jgi:hypothetical protein
MIILYGKLLNYNLLKIFIFLNNLFKGKKKMFRMKILNNFPK